LQVLLLVYEYKVEQKLGEKKTGVSMSQRKQESKIHRNYVCRNSRRVWKHIWSWTERVNRCLR